MGPLRVVKAILRRTPLPKLLRRWQRNQEYNQWIRRGKPMPPPPVVKHRTIKQYAERFQLQILVETGTCMGDTVEAMQPLFERVYSIELSDHLYTQAQRRFAGIQHVTILHGDSSEILPTILSQVERPCLFWLDGHYSAGETARGALDTPILQELYHIFRHPLALSHIILIDDARLFTGETDYPSIETLRTVAKTCGFDDVEIGDDIIRIKASI